MQRQRYFLVYFTAMPPGPRAVSGTWQMLNKYLLNEQKAQTSLTISRAHCSTKVTPVVWRSWQRDMYLTRMLQSKVGTSPNFEKEMLKENVLNLVPYHLTVFFFFKPNTHSLTSLPSFFHWQENCYTRSTGVFTLPAMKENLIVLFFNIF